MNMCMADFISPKHRFRNSHVYRPRAPRRDYSSTTSCPELNGDNSPSLPRKAFGRTKTTPTLPTILNVPRNDSCQNIPQISCASQSGALNYAWNEAPGKNIPVLQEDDLEESSLDASNTSSSDQFQVNITEADYQRTFDKTAHLLR